jgi:hypothetical protein
MNDLVVLLLRAGRNGNSGTVRVTPPDTLRVGRAASADFVIAGDPHVSSVHFRLAFREGEWWVHDLESRNGTYVNGARVRQSVVRDGDQISAGETTFRVAFEMRAPQPALPTDWIGDTEVADAYVSVAAETPPTEWPRIVTPSPFTVGTAYSEDSDGRAWLSIVVKGTWTLDTPPKAAAIPLPIFTSDRLATDDPLSPVRFESDLVPIKPRADVVLVGSAHSPSGQPVTELVAGLRVGTLRHAVTVIGDRVWRWHASGQLPTISRPQPFTTMELVYERAFGGIDRPGAMYCKENLAGTGYIGGLTKQRIDGLRLPNLEDPNHLIVSWDSRPTPTGFGFFGRGSMPRLAYAGTYDDTHLSERHPLMPVDFSPAFFNGAHPSLQVEGYLAGDEEVVLLNVCPDAPEKRFRLPGVVPTITVSRWTETPHFQAEDLFGPEGTVKEGAFTDEVVTPVLDTLVFVPDEGIFYEVFRGRCRLSSLDSLELARIVIKA